MNEAAALRGWVFRLGQIVEWLGGSKQAAATAEVSRRAIHAYVAAANEPPFSVVARLAAGAEVSLDWLATGDAPIKRAAPSEQSRPLDAALLAEIVEMVEAEALRRGSRPTSQKYAEIVVHLYRVALRLSLEKLASDNVAALFDIAA